MGNRTALYLASKNNNLQSVKALLAGKANPGIKTFGGQTAYQIADNERIRGFLAKAFLLHICMPLIPAKKRQSVWKNEGLLFFKSEDHIYISDFA